MLCVRVCANSAARAVACAGADARTHECAGAGAGAGTRLHDDLEARERVGDDDVDRRHDGRRDQVGARLAEIARGAQLLLDVLLQARLADEPEDRRRERVAHQRDRAAEERHEVLRGGLAHDLHERLLGASLLQERALLLLDHPNGVDERGREDRGGGRRREAGLARLVARDHAVAEQDAKLGDTLEEHACVGESTHGWMRARRTTAESWRWVKHVRPVHLPE